MNLLRRILRIEDKQYTAESAAVSEAIFAAQKEKQETARRIEKRAHQQALRSSDMVFNTWQGASSILRDRQ